MPIDIDLPNEEIEVRIVLNEVTIEPGASWSVPFDLANQFRGRSGEITITAGNTGPSTSIGAGEFASYGSGNLLVLTNNGSEPAELMHGIILIADPNGPEVIPPDGVTIEIFGAGSFFASGPVTAMMTVERVSGTGSSTMVHGELLDVRLYTVLDGAMELTRLAGQIEVQKIGEAPMAPRTLEAIGDRIDLTAGESFFAHSGASYRFESAESGQLATLVVHTRAPQVATSASPVASPNASPAAESDGTSHRSEGNLLPVRAEYCTVEARPLDEFAAILADPYVSGTPVANFRSDSATGVPADDETIAGVTDTILQIVACNSPASIEMYSLYSQNALRFQAMHGMTIEEIESLEPFAPDTDYPGHVLGHVAVENVTLLPDGRATAMVSANGEIAFVTFIYEDGRWLIDFWDDSLED
jgi:mannose-6-phosphate isomerase-like protein (cupin superfamily)